MNFDLSLRLLTILIFILVRVYWYVAKQKAIKIKKETNNKLMNFEKIGMILGAIFILLNLIGFTVLTFNNAVFQLSGLILVILGCGEAVVGRHALGINWTESYEYQIKKNHQMITSGIYKYVRHPIYGGLMIAVTGAFIVAQTYLFILMFLLQFMIMAFLAKREESLLKDYFGNKYNLYIQTTKMFIPFIV